MKYVDEKLLLNLNVMLTTDCPFKKLQSRVKTIKNIINELSIALCGEEYDFEKLHEYHFPYVDVVTNLKNYGFSEKIYNNDELIKEMYIWFLTLCMFIEYPEYIFQLTDSDFNALKNGKLNKLSFYKVKHLPKDFRSKLKKYVSPKFKKNVQEAYEKYYKETGREYFKNPYKTERQFNKILNGVENISLRQSLTNLFSPKFEKKVIEYKKKNKKLVDEKLKNKDKEMLRLFYLAENI